MTLAQELIEDRALETAEQDMLRHADLARSLTDLIGQTSTPANIALFGRWGSGKSGLANLVAAQLKEKAGYRFVRFDAFKYAEAPLRRQFLSQVANELSIGDSAYSKGLYQSSVTNTLRVPPMDVVRTIGLLTIAILGAGLIWMLVLAAIAALGDGTFWEDFQRLANGGAALALAPAAVLTALLTIAGKAFTIERSSIAPSSDEEFERLFRELVTKADASKLVIFIDELDRCSSAEVVSTLETVRTFLDVESCVFIVAADQQVLEQALSREARQTTPDDPSNPYYSAGSAYLDKIFQYQIEIPALRPRKLTTFALALVRDRGGLWQEIDIESVVSVLIPTHVRSPRRVKRLLNNFVLAYRVANVRAQAGVLTSQIAERAEELAKLVCLRTEFPLFATDLAVDARLIELVMRFVEDPHAEVSGQIPERVANLARLYAAKRLPVAALVGLEREPSLAGPDRIPAAKSDDIGEESATEQNASGGDRQMDVVTDTRATYADQLIRYLQKTEHIPGPHRDLIHLESSGADFGLDPNFADQIEDDAIDGRTEQVLSLVADLAPDQAEGVIRLLAHRVRESSVGVEGENAVSTLLQVLALLNVELMGVSDEVAVALATFLARYELRPEDLSGALAIGLDTHHPVGTQLVTAVVGRPETLTDADLRTAIVDNAARLPNHLAVVGAAFVAALEESLEEAEVVSSSLAQLDTNVSVRIVLLSADNLATRWAAHQSEADEGSPDIVTPSESDYSLADGLETAMDAFVTSNQPLAEALTTVILDFDTKEARDLVRSYLPRMSPLRSAEATDAVLAAAASRTVQDWPGWLSHLDNALTAHSEATDRLVGLTVKLWTSASGDKPPSAEAVAEAAAQIVRLAPEGLLPQRSGALAEAVSGSFSVDPVGDAAVDTLRTALMLANQLASSGVLDFGVAPSALQGVARAFPANIPAQPTSGPIVRYLIDAVPTLVDDVSEIEELRSLRTSAASALWLTPPGRETIVLQVTRRIRALDDDDPIPITYAEISGLIISHGESAIQAVVAWLACAPNPEDVWPAIKPLAGAELPGGASDALLAFTEALTPSERLEVARPALSEALEQMPHQSSFLAIRFSESDEAAAAAALIDLYSGATNLEQRERILTLWHQLNPVRADIKRTLINSIFLPLAEGSVGGFDIAVKNLSLVQGASERTQEEVIESLRSSSPPDKHLRLETRLRDSGLVKRSILERIFRSDDGD